MLSGKCGLVYCHMGAAKEGLQPLMDAVAMSDVPITQFLPTHVERTPELIAEGAQWIKAGGKVNLTCRTEEVVLSGPCVSCQFADVDFVMGADVTVTPCSDALPLTSMLSAHTVPRATR